MLLTPSSPRPFLRALFDAAVHVADPMQVVPQHLPPRPQGRLVVIGAGKASARMAEAVETHYGPCEGLVITRYGYARPCQHIEIVEAAHPVPDAAGEAATRRMYDLVSSLGPDDTVLALISGGGSALLCAPKRAISLQDKMDVNRALLASGAPIGQINIVRKHLSLVKGGQLAAACYPAPVQSLLISDVPGDDPALIASGPTVGETSATEDARRILDRYNIDLPKKIDAALSTESSVVRPGDPRLARAQTKVIAAPSQSLSAAASKAAAAGCRVRILGDALEGEARDLGRDQAQLAKSLLEDVTATGTPLLLLSGGECTVTRTGDGIGGPNAEFVLAAAIALGEQPDIHVMACDTDGVDGAAEVAGAYADAATLAHARSMGLSPETHLNENNAHTFFERLDSQIVTGPTLTNVNDFRAILINPTA
ncbi:glycerate kinase [Nereida sp. MMG025]|uniref:glycerate kinase type-2 family protein n=1 Tax=Nereida sp. MMG025 TaxID=2909981 RepID=UPI0021053BCD|nr:glycerate kinase [Nereida sp. MMG025]